MAQPYAPVEQQYDPAYKPLAAGVAPVDAVPVVGTIPERPRRARPLFPMGNNEPMNFLYGHIKNECVCQGTGTTIPEHWLDAGHGWSTAYFVDVQPYNKELKHAGTYRCTIADPNGQYFTVKDDETDCGCCWCARGRAPERMAAHLKAVHGMRPPPKRAWASGLFDTGSCLDAWCCMPCTASRQIMASHGHTDRMNLCFCLYFSMLLTSSAYDNNGGQNNNVHVPSWMIAAFITRYRIVKLNNIDEDCCSTMCIACWCAHCSLAQTHREFTAAGVWPGGECQGGAPVRVLPMNNPPPTMTINPNTALYPACDATVQQPPMSPQGGDYGAVKGV